MTPAASMHGEVTEYIQTLQNGIVTSLEKLDPNAGLFHRDSWVSVIACLVYVNVGYIVCLDKWPKQRHILRLSPASSWIVRQSQLNTRKSRCPNHNWERCTGAQRPTINAIRACQLPHP